MRVFDKSNTEAIKGQLLRARDGIRDEGLVAEASDPSTPAERLAELANSDDPWVRHAAARNPNAGADAFYNIAFG